MLIFAGLGNPGGQYAGHRHNIGFMALDALAQAQGFSAWKKAFSGVVSEGRLGNEKVLLLKPETFMNRSGQSVGEAMRYYKLSPEDITVFHDELDLAPGKVRLKSGGGHAGHNGLRSIHAHIGGSYDRVRLGIGHPGQKDKVAGYVLHDFSQTDRDWLEPLLEGISKAAPLLAAGDGPGFLNQIALRTVPQRKAASPAPKPKLSAAPEPDTRSPLERLVDKFK